MNPSRTEPNVAIAALKLRDRYGADFVRQLAAALSRLVYVETGEAVGQAQDNDESRRTATAEGNRP